MIDGPLALQILERTRAYWNLHIQTDEFARIASGKEVGHRIAEEVEERTTELLHLHFDSRYERDSKGDKVSRSMGDIWILSNGIYNPINVKSGEMGKNGQPNMVALKRLLKALLTDRIDSYHLLFVKFILAQPITCSIYLVDLLDYLDTRYVTFDSGPGQIMLKEHNFYQAITSGTEIPVRTLQEKVKLLFELLEDGERRLALNRQRELSRLREMVDGYIIQSPHIIDQTGMHLG